MTNFNIYKNNNMVSKKEYPYLVDVQSSLLSSLETRLVIPVALATNFSNKIIKNLNPIILIHNKSYVVLTQQMAAVPIKYIGDLVCEGNSTRLEILSAIDFLITGF